MAHLTREGREAVAVGGRALVGANDKELSGVSPEDAEMLVSLLQRLIANLQGAEFIADELDGEGPTAEVEIPRGDLARLLFEPAQVRADVRFGAVIARIENGQDHAEVTFSNGRSEPYDLVVVAEGVGSTTREQIFPGENDPRWRDLTIACFTIPRTADDDRKWRWRHTTGGRSISLRGFGDRRAERIAEIALSPPSDAPQAVDRAGDATLPVRRSPLSCPAGGIKDESETTSAHAPAQDGASALRRNANVEERP